MWLYILFVLVVSYIVPKAFETLLRSMFEPPSPEYYDSNDNDYDDYN